MDPPQLSIQWAPRLRPERIRQLYQNDARGLYDEDLIDSVGYALRARCESILRVTSAMRGRIVCPACERAFDRNGADALTCPGCGWSTTWSAYHRTFRGKKLYAGAIEEPVRAFLTTFDAARSPRDKVIAIDRLIHTFHHEATAHPTAPAAKNLIAGNVEEVVALLNELTFGTATPELQETKQRYQQVLPLSPYGGRPHREWVQAFKDRKRARREETA